MNWSISTRYNRCIAVLALVAMVFTMLLAGCSTTKSAFKAGFDSPYKIGRRVAGVYYLSDRYMSPETEHIVVLSWKVFDRIVAEAPENRKTTVRLMHKFIGELDIPPEIRPEVSELAFSALNEILNDLPAELEPMKFALAIEEVHRGITERIADHEAWQNSYNETPSLKQ